jgi:hypothetical protein
MFALSILVYRLQKPVDYASRKRAGIPQISGALPPDECHAHVRACDDNRTPTVRQPFAVKNR